MSDHQAFDEPLAAVLVGQIKAALRNNIDSMKDFVTTNLWSSVEGKERIYVAHRDAKTKGYHGQGYLVLATGEVCDVPTRPELPEWAKEILKAAWGVHYDGKTAGKAMPTAPDTTIVVREKPTVEPAEPKSLDEKAAALKAAWKEVFG